jgi:predicted HTH transcriptional regulator
MDHDSLFMGKRELPLFPEGNNAKNKMLAERLNSVIKQGEGINIEFKECKNKLSNEVFETVCAFLNRFGGELLLGVNKLGSGVKKLFKYCKAYSGQNPKLIEEDIFKAIIPLSKQVTEQAPSKHRAT